MGRATNGLPPSPDPTVGNTGHPSRMNNRPGQAGPCNPESISNFMMGIGIQENVNLQTEEIRRPGAVHVRPTSDASEVDTYLDINEDRSNLPIDAHLPPIEAHLASDDEADMEAILEARWTARMAQEMEDRTRQEMTQTREEFPVSADGIVVVADEVKDVWTHEGQKNRRKWIMAVLLLFVFVGGMATFLLLRDKDGKQVDAGSEALSQSDAPSEHQSNAPSFSPVPVDPLVEELRSWIAPTREDLLRFLDASSPQFQALTWLQDDPITLTPGRSTQTVLERYVLAVLYYSTSGPFWNFEYFSDEDVCTWNNGRPATNDTESMVGVYCVEGGDSIGTLALSENNLNGPLPWELALLTTLEVLDVGKNSLAGSIPTRIMTLTSLEVLNIYVNSLTGSIPAEISKLTRLEIFLASANGLTGTLPATLSPRTVEINLGTNSLTGPIPDSWWTTMPALKRLSLRQNRLTGSLPSTIGGLSNLLTIWIDNNLLTGRLPTLTDLNYFAAGDNAFSGPLPTSFPASVEVVNLEDNALTGTIPSTWGDSMPILSSLSIKGNSLTGTVPFSLGQVTTLTTFTFNSNSLTGSVEYLCDVGNWASLEADCPEPVTCSCCTTCHDAA